MDMGELYEIMQLYYIIEQRLVYYLIRVCHSILYIYMWDHDLKHKSMLGNPLSSINPIRLTWNTP